MVLDSRVIFVSTTPQRGCRLACSSPAHLTRFTRFYQYFVSASIRFYILQASEPWTHLFGRGIGGIRSFRAGKDASSVDIAMKWRSSMPTNPVGGVVLTKITPEDEQSPCRLTRLEYPQAAWW